MRLVKPMKGKQKIMEMRIMRYPYLATAKVVESFSVMRVEFSTIGWIWTSLTCRCLEEEVHTNHANSFSCCALVFYINNKMKKIQLTLGKIIFICFCSVLVIYFIEESRWSDEFSIVPQYFLQKNAIGKKK